MTTETVQRNEAAERIRNYDGQYGHPLSALVDEALMTERQIMAREVSERVHSVSGRHPDGYEYIDTESVDRFLYTDRP